MQLKPHTLLFALSLPLSGYLVSCAQNSSRDDQNIIAQNSSIKKDSYSKKKNPRNKYTATPYCTDLMDSTANPLGPYAWHLYNYGNPAYATAYTEEEHAASLGKDINAYSVLKEYCLSGSGVSVAVVDSGMQVEHPSLSPNIDNRPNASKTWSVNYRNNRLSTNDPSPIEEDDIDHGTMVSGIIAMRSNLGVGGTGVAPRANLSAYNVINYDTQLFDNFYESLGSSAAAENNDIFNMSYGMDNTSQVSTDDPVSLAGLAMYKTGTRLLRHGKGALYVKAAGNGFGSLGSVYDFVSCKAANTYGVSCQDVSMNTDNAMPEVISIAALNSFGKKTSYSTTGAGLWVSTPGGEFSFDKNWIEEELDRFDEKADWSDYIDALSFPAIISTDMLGSRSGFAQRIDMDDTESIFNARNKFNAGLVPENESFNYTNSMNGTSAATPIAVGAMAVLLEANPDLTWRDVKYILAKTATKVDPEFAGVTAQLPHGEFELQQGWLTNAAGFHFSNWYGFGGVDLKAAVDLAVDFESPLGRYIEKPWWPKGKALNKNVPAGEYAGVTRTVTVAAGDNLVVESLQLKVSLASGYVGDAAIEVTSPSGTRNIVWHAGNGFSNHDDLSDMLMLSNAFYGEESVGSWKVRVINTGIHDEDVVWTGLQLKVSGYQKGK